MAGAGHVLEFRSPQVLREEGQSRGLTPRRWRHRNTRLGRCPAENRRKQPWRPMSSVPVIKRNRLTRFANKPTGVMRVLEVKPTPYRVVEPAARSEFGAGRGPSGGQKRSSLGEGVSATVCSRISCRRWARRAGRMAYEKRGPIVGTNFFAHCCQSSLAQTRFRIVCCWAPRVNV